MDPESKRTLNRIRTRMAEKGKEMTPDQTLDAIKDLEGKFQEKFGYGLIKGSEIFRKMDDTPPPPPYRGYFDDEKEALSFKKRAEEAHKVKLLAIRQDDGKIKLKEIEVP